MYIYMFIYIDVSLLETESVSKYIYLIEYYKISIVFLVVVVLLRGERSFVC